MIPCKVTMTGWMRYREKQTVDFEGGRLVAICGENGAGKSAIFDAITYSLYGLHRLSRNRDDSIADLISEGENRLRVEFEFEAGDTRYLVWRERARGRASGSQGMSFWDAEVNDWVPITGTQYVDGLKRQVSATIRLTQEAFTSSFLLQQGEAARFVEAGAGDRFKIVRSLIGLEAYEDLEKRAGQRARQEVIEAKRIEQQLQQYDGIDADLLAELVEAREAARLHEEAATGARVAAAALLRDAQDFAQRTTEVIRLSALIDEAETLLTDRGQIEAAAARFDALASERALLVHIADELAKADAADQAAAIAEQAASAILLDALESGVEESKARAEQAASALETSTATFEDAVAQERDAAEFKARAEAIVEMRGRIAELETQLGADVEALAHFPALEAEEANLRALAAALPALDALASARARVEERQAGDPERQLAELQRWLAASDEQRRTLAEQVADREQESSQRQQEAAECRAAAAESRAQLQQRRDAASEPVCSRCGQRIDVRQAQAELAGMAARATAAQQAAHAATEAAQSARSRHQEAATRLKAEDRQREAVQAKRHAAEGVIRSLADARTDEAQWWEAFEMAAPDSLRLSAAEDRGAAALRAMLARHRDVPGRLDALNRSLVDLQRRRGASDRAREEQERLIAALARNEGGIGARLPDVQRAGALHEEARRRLAEMRTARDRAREAAQAAEAAREQAAAALRRGAEARRAHEATAGTHYRTAGGHRSAAAAHARSLSHDLRDRALAAPRAALEAVDAEHSALVDAPGRMRALQQAEANRNLWMGQRLVHEEVIARIPAAHRIAKPAAEAALRVAEAAATDAGARSQDLQRRVIQAETDLKQAESLRQRFERARRRLELLQRLAKYLDRQHLQGVLVGDALTTVMSHANGFLQRLTGGSLQLILQPGTGDALELKAIDASSMRTARSVQVLSGSQKFRCAVAIASGIGQYAGAGGMRSIVIDEGFGSLDLEGQRLIIEELKALAEHMDRVIVVSHLEAFTNRDHFPDQVRVIPSAAGSRIERVS